MSAETAHDAMTTWHITWGTYGTRLHGGERATVELSHNQPGEGFVAPNPGRVRFEREQMRGKPIYLSEQQRLQIEQSLPELCKRGGWTLRECAAALEGDHVHVILDAPQAVQGKAIRQLLKRWLTQAMNSSWGIPASGAWWAKGGSTRVVGDDRYLHTVTEYVRRQRTSRAK